MDSIAVVTGGAGDIGRAIATKLAETHNHVVLVDIDEARVTVAADTLGTEKARAMICDITDNKQVQEMAQKIMSLGVVCTLVNNAGATWAGSLHELSPEIWKREVTLNLEASFLCFHAFEESLKRARGSVVNVASVNGLSVFGNPAYSSAKAGLIHLTRSIAVEYGKFGIRANAVAPGTVRTRAWEHRVEANPQVFEEAMRWYPLKHVIEPDDIANAVAFLSSKQAAAITGVCLSVDSGLTAGQTCLARGFSQSEYY
ncbi:2-(S)-hydroxypropyl-CoM dehydrogenase, putative [Coccidioides posadasii C735 delta SOWgp]|uniref:2-(S)-hydroxypropyl-CoM dehydrogenase, putative n=1 Tax=Coccidioides posadasii (strain C735) TaxID=222929 RepID=C5P0M6_COCP7|nr:2-(S)-hydroxypropyl-CoM dehydrogenase, putative [Coccidioides posadasii C735 delta SOWgp]EER29234.1 2-(S)-hydroxypropyl-CoM dehydrogenase, putative [Coccidioides posadasii C735 delta SOWgp]|eukprot:XP_003071379.1 2-(S)-hydroxypropyl-CoM dehydrogenase, putative [Coccidioides posadasii C735 delta SOWgp]